MKNKKFNDKIPVLGKNKANLASNSKNEKIQGKRDGYARKIVPKTISRARADISTWKSALRSADNVENPKRAKLYNLYNDILLDAHLTSQIELRMQHTLGVPFVLKREDGKEAEEETRRLRSARWVTELSRQILQSIYWGHSLVEIETKEDNIQVIGFPANNVIPEKGILLLSEDSDRGIEYRNVREYGTWILEFGNDHDYGLLNKAIPHVLFKRFAQSCWSELCEIYGIPPRYIKTDTQDSEMLDRAETMLRDMGSAAWFIIDSTEEFQFAKGADTNGDVYNNLISLCNSEISLLITGAVIGQDTVNGNRSKEESSMKLLDKLVQSDKSMLESYWNGVVIPALVRIGILPAGLNFCLQQEEDLEKLWGMTRDVLPYNDVNPAWIKEKFGIDVTGKRELPGSTGLSIDTSGFFD
ncbi:hypothetical protein DMB45_00305 [Sanguibacteroides justesenii]|uniref:phage portal protein family protein n=1 Tax=Sanguibacteroides justesenii TaxID=1547597 RepID=UPI000D8C069E|nr:DUF935 family protein [Sanguibacteroides justesenii]PXZ44925.1 hypothetical protein DMB45_00305 [Sanguibacteroides justesenii]